MSKEVEFSIDDIFGDSLNLKLDEEEKVKEETYEKAEKQKLVKVTEEGIVILDDELMEKVKKKNLSASMVSSFFDCPADWLMNSFILPLLDYEEPEYFVRGNIFHESMERFFALPKEERNPKTLSQTTMNLIKEKHEEQLTNRETMEWVKQALKGYLDTGFAYQDVDIAQIVQKEEKGPEPGIEIFVRGKLGNTTRDVVGFVDRVDQMDDGRLQIVDYKSGKKIHPFDPNQPIGEKNNFGYWRQQLAYSMLLEQSGNKIGGAKLEFPIAKGEVIVDVNNQDLREQVKRDFEAVDEAFNKCIEDNLFPFNGHIFCKWCGMLSPNHTPSRFGKLNVSWEDVTQHVELLS